MRLRLALITLAFVVSLAGCKGDTGAQGPAGPAGPAGAAAGSSTAMNIKIQSATIAADGTVQVTYTLTDAKGNNIALDNVSNSWTLATLGTDADSGLPAYQALIFRSATGTIGGTVQQPTSETEDPTKSKNLGNGQYQYTFTTKAPAGFSTSATYRVGVYSRRLHAGVPSVPSPTSADYDISNDVLDFVPAGGTPQTYDLVTTNNCNTCHGILQVHGGFRREVRLCTTCHTTQLVDPDTQDTGVPTDTNGNKNPNPLDLGRLIHRIHSGANLPTVVDAASPTSLDTNWKYHVIGFGGADIVYGQVIANPNPATSAKTPFVTTGVLLPQDIRNCAVCHGTGGPNDAPQSGAYFTNSARRTCTGCHDDVWFRDTSAPVHHVNHPAGPQPNDQSCKGCHPAQGVPYDISVSGVHVFPGNSADFHPLKFDIVSVTNTTAGAGGTNPTVTIKVSNANDGSPVTNIATLDVLAVVLSGPTTDYSFANQVRQSLLSSTTPRTVLPGVDTGGAAQGQYAVTFTNRTAPDPKAGQPAIPAGSTGTWAVGVEGRRVNTGPLAQHEQKLGIVSTAAIDEYPVANPVSYFWVDGTPATTPVVKRRQVVSIDNCNQCHQHLSVHGANRVSTEYCVLCHAPDLNDLPQRTASTTPPSGTDNILPGDKTSVARGLHLKSFIHSIHTGENLQIQVPFVVYGFGNAPVFLNDIRFPGTRARCTMCHADTTYVVDAIPDTAQPSNHIQTAPMGSGATPTATYLPITATCLSCHDDSTAQNHAKQQSTFDTSTTPPTQTVESCAVCHGEGTIAAVTQVHQKFIQ